MAHIHPDPDKALFWISEIESLLAASVNRTRLEKLIGRLCFAVYAVWGPPARAYLTPLYSFFHGGGGRHHSSIRTCLSWWRSRLAGSVSRTWQFGTFRSQPLIAYSDAEGAGGLGWVLLARPPSLESSKSGDPSLTGWWAGGAAPADLSAHLLPRKTQIHALEMCAFISLIQSSATVLRGKRLLAFIDNQSALGVLRKGSCKLAHDLSALSSYALDLCRGLHIELFLFWVPSALNCADGPSRGNPCPFGLRGRLLLQVQPLAAAISDPALRIQQFCAQPLRAKQDRNLR